MAVDTSRASERLRAWNEGDDDALPRGYTHDSLDFQRDLRALLARAEAAESERDGAKTALVHTCLTLSHVERQRDAATAERDRLTEAFSAIEAECWDVRCIDVPTGCGDADVQWVVIAHYMAAPKEREVGHGTSPLSAIQAALASINKGPTDGE